MALGRSEALVEIRDVREQVDFFDRPCVLDGIAILLIEGGILHRSQSQIKSGIENHDGLLLFECDLIGKLRSSPDFPENK